MYSCTLSLTSALDSGVGGQRHASVSLPPGNTRYPFYRILAGSQSRSGRVRKNLAPPPTAGIRSPAIQANSDSLY
jgi:hypothetical protein